MQAKLIDGKEIAAQIYTELQMRLAALSAKGIIPHLSVVLVGDDPASQVYVRTKQKTCEKYGLGSETLRLPAETPEKQVLDLLDKLNKNPQVHGILVQLPLPKGISTQRVIEQILPEKDVDGFHPINRGRLVAGQDCFLPCTPAGMQQLLARYGYSPENKHVVVVGRSLIVGLPFAIMMVLKKEHANATVTICHTGTKNLADHTRSADILVAASGRPNTITADMVREGVVVIDVGVNRVEDPSAERGYRLIGDVDFAGVSQKAAAITPVPGGVGPMTIAMLLMNTVRAAENSLT
ncbi:MAG TPA: bifunctional methylenetetrahydrofolate dehydrogenase/methenyltetrahydrofolate cyclohydrolase FolD [bacterium]|jgi:methylenetetrahydrofolate dehydrogenase (NADP+)/methenyltetrahydrofolate cyclohydrolase|nr:bifunctional methylenetetrahydrofolate dehydrogenase/methenyltetrahydrofolate cyclohydrolase FolD [bacterium]HNT65494.1 bifunctional methylenetetrahydrofolate dehydrogenase/methenyltetrahydrofolate cyclohydrolase FolD [bacterium]HOX87559.1 bifunctional methylenetetrahydrofolate dehydrogenase/methenyltetrahydrofolate cyclohydrolase FolD [bacterium]HPG47257.1 bifunctional methylenetetrahydrofolate dehydrogenase/methenyltetrahydrofolate cyclohydrolase FolD [bacterium]HPM99537.1 bifunctional met